MRKSTQRVQQLKDFVLDNVAEHPQDISRLTSERFGISRQSVSKHLHSLIDEGLLDASGVTRARRYSLRTTAQVRYGVDVTPDLQEDREWRLKILPLLDGVSDNVLRICNFGFTEMLNNVIDHSESPNAIITASRTHSTIDMQISDLGVGIFDKLQKEFDLDDPRHVVLELSKGKLTSDPDAHTGEGIFFTSRIFDEFRILSGTLFFSRTNRVGDEWLLESEDRDRVQGTLVTMSINVKSERTTEAVFNSFASGAGDYGFTRTHVPIELVRYEGEGLVSRSQAKRLLARFDRFNEVLVDFKGVTEIGQAFADEIFRVYHGQHPNVDIMSVNAVPDVDRMIKRAIANRTNVGP